MSDLRITKIENHTGSKKQEILLYLKKHGQTDLKTLHEALEISKMGVLKHITALEELGYVERETQKAPKGRPKVLFKLSESTRDNVFPNSYSDLTEYFLKYIEENYGIQAVEKALKDRNIEAGHRYEKELKGKTLSERVVNLRTLRDKEGYMAEQKKVSDESYELLEYNCPIFRIAEEYGFTCNLEREMFEELLHADVESTHRVVDGQNVCRFLISKKH